jgi:hypothetical protein
VSGPSFSLVLGELARFDRDLEFAVIRQTETAPRTTEDGRQRARADLGTGFALFMPHPPSCRHLLWQTGNRRRN